MKKGRNEWGKWENCTAEKDSPLTPLTPLGLQALWQLRMSPQSHGLNSQMSLFQMWLQPLVQSGCCAEEMDRFNTSSSRRKSIESKFTVVSKSKSEINASANERLQSQQWKSNKGRERSHGERPAEA